MANTHSKGFLGFSHYGHPCFIREEYEAAHEGEDELTRLEDALEMNFSDFNSASSYALTHARYLLYRLESDEIDQELLRGRDPWIAYCDGYVHIVTGEFVPGGLYPQHDSYPCWKKEEPASRYLNSYDALHCSGYIGMLAMFFGALATMMGAKR